MNTVVNRKILAPGLRPTAKICCAHSVHYVFRLTKVKIRKRRVVNTKRSGSRTAGGRWKLEAKAWVSEWKMSSSASIFRSNSAQTGPAGGCAARRLDSRKSIGLIRVHRLDNQLDERLYAPCHGSKHLDEDDIEGPHLTGMNGLPRMPATSVLRG